MKNLLNKYNFYCLILIIASLLSYRSWLNLGIHSHGDWWFEFSETLSEHLLPYVWETGNALGYTEPVLFRLPLDFLSSSLAIFFGIGSHNIDKLLYFWPQIFLLPLASYLFFNLLLNNRISATASAFIVSFNTYILAITTQGHNLITVAFAFYILGLYIFLKALRDKQISLYIYSALIFSLSGYIDLRVLYIGVFVAFALTMSHLHMSGITLKHIKGFIVLGLSVVGLNLIWLIPIIFGKVGFGEGVLARPLFGDQYWSLQHALTLMHPFWTGGEIGWFIQQPIPWYFWFSPVLAALGLMVARKKPYTIAFAVIGLVGIFLTKQADAPLSWFYPWAYENIPGFNAFREASKFYILIILSYGFFIGHIIKWVQSNAKNHFGKYALPVFVCILFFYNTIPLVTGSIGTMFVSKEIENDYKVLQQHLLSDTSFYRTYWTPIRNRWIFESSTHPSGSILDLSNKEELLLGNSALPTIRKTEALFQLSYANALLDSMSIKYIGVPTSGLVNDEDLFKDYGGRTDPNIRNLYIDQLRSASYLVPANIETSDLVIYENSDYLPHIRSTPELTTFNSAINLSNKFTFSNITLKSNSDFVLTNQNSLAYPSIKVSQILEDINVENTSGSMLTDDMPTIDTGYQLYTNKNNQLVEFRNNGSLLQLNQIYAPGLAYKNIIADDLTSDISLATIPLNALSSYVAGIGSRIINLSISEDWQSLGSVNEPITVYQVSGVKTIANGSFEDGLWAETVGNCNNFDDLPILGMEQAQVSSVGSYSLQLSATRHTACTNTSVSGLQPGQEYLFSFDYQGDPAEQAGFYLSFNTGTSTVISERLPIEDKEWKTYKKIITAPADIENARLYLYAYSTDEETNNVVRYDNVQIRSIDEVETINVPTEDNFAATPIDIEAGTSTFTFTNPDGPMVNLIRNGSLKDGLWRSVVGDCNNYDDLPMLDMRIVVNNNDDSQALELEATRHTACTGPASVPITEGTDYLLSFDYQSDMETEAGFNLTWNGTTTPAVNERIQISDTGWQTFSERVTAPAGASSASLLLYAYEGDGINPVRVRYDNVSLIELPDIFNRYYLVSDPKTNFVEPRETNFTLVNPTKKTVTIKGATTPFYLAMSESYHPQWQAQFNNSKITGFFQGWVPFVTPDRISDEHHFELNGFLNGWYIDTAVHCEQNNLCTKNPDGSYDIEMTIEFFPQRWFYLGLLISGTTLVSVIGYLVHDAVRRRRIKTSSVETLSK